MKKKDILFSFILKVIFHQTKINVSNAKMVGWDLKIFAIKDSPRLEHGKDM